MLHAKRVCPDGWTRSYLMAEKMIIFIAGLDMTANVVLNTEPMNSL